jgi:hypothetical protein
MAHGVYHGSTADIIGMIDKDNSKTAGAGIFLCELHAFCVVSFD